MAEPATQPAVEILGVSIQRVDGAQMLAQIEAWLAAPTTPEAASRQICTVNPEFIVDARRDPAFAAVLRRADLRVADGVGVLWAAWLLGAPLPERVTGSDGIYKICERATQYGWRVYFLGAAPGVAERTAAILQARNPGLQIAGASGGNPSDAEWPAIQQRLLSSRAQILFVAYGHPRQDFWIDRHRHELPVQVAIGVGGAFDFVTGKAVRAPHWLQRLGLEWLHRLLHESWRWRRMLKLPQFVVLVLWQALRRG